jgi:hypothetical protein
MKQTVEWACFVIGGLLILTAVLTHLFKISLGGATVEGQSNWGQKVVAFIAGWVFVIIGGSFHGVSMYLAYNVSAAVPSAQQTIPSTTVSPNAKPDNESPVPGRRPAVPASSQTRDVGLAGLWRDEGDGMLVQISQTGSTLKLSLMNGDQEPVGGGNGSVEGNTVMLQIVLNGVPGTCDLRLSSDKRQMQGSCRADLAGAIPSPTTLARIE